MVMPVLNTAWPHVRHVAGSSYVAAGGATGFQLTGSDVGIIAGIAFSIVTLTLTIIGSNRKTRREVADDMRKEYVRGRQDRERELKPWLEWWEGVARGEFPALHGPGPHPPTPAPGSEDDDESDTED